MLMWTCGRHSMHRYSGVVMHTPSVVNCFLCVVYVCMCTCVVTHFLVYTDVVYVPRQFSCLQGANCSPVQWCWPKGCVRTTRV